MNTGKFSRTILAISAFWLPGLFALAPALGVPVLKARIEVESRVVTAGDMFTNAGDLAAKPLFLAPAPGTTGEVLLADVQRAMARAGIDEFDAAGLSSIFVARRGLNIDLAFLTDLIAGELVDRGIIDDTETIELVLSRQLPVLIADISALEPVRLEDFQFAPGSARFAARLFVAGRRNPVELTGRADRLIAVPVLTNSLGRGDLIGAGDYRFTLVPARLALEVLPPTGEELIGKTVRRPMRAGTTLRAIDVVLPKLVARNQAVTLYFRSGALFLTAKGRALDDATLNEPVNVLNLGSKKIIRGIAVSGGTVLVAGSATQFSPIN